MLNFERMEARTLLAPFTVTSPLSDDAGTVVGSLRYEINQSNLVPATAANPNLINFALPVGQQTIALTSQLPDIVQPTLIDGYSQAGSSPNTNLFLAPDNAVLTVIITGGGGVGNGFILDATAAAGSHIRGLDLEGFSFAAINNLADNVTIDGNFIGTGANGVPTASTLNGYGVILSGASGSTIGGVAAANRNVITGSTGAGVNITAQGATLPTNNVVEGNYIGTNADLTAVINPAFTNPTGVIQFAGTGNTIGGMANGTGNVISGNSGNGFAVQNSTGTMLAGDLIQFNGNTGVVFASTPGGSIIASTIGGTAAGLGNGARGISISNSPNLTIGGPALGAGVLVAGNTGVGVRFQGTSSGGQVLNSTISGNTGDGIDAFGTSGSPLTGMVLTGDTIAANLGIGVVAISSPGIAITASTIGGPTPGLGNGLAGISLVGSTGSIIGGTLAGAGDLVGFNGGDGIVFDSNSSGGSVTGSTISGNTGVGISYSSTISGTVTGLTNDLIQSNLLGGVLISNATGAGLSGLTIGGPGTLGNGGYGVSVTGSSNVTLGGTVAGAGLTVQGNFGPGVAIAATSTGVQVLGSTITGNTGDGLDITNSVSIVVTGDTIASNLGNGVLVTATPGVAITASTIGGPTPGLGNGLAGIALVGSTGAIIGGTLAGAGDFVGFNGGDGIVFDAASTGGSVTGSTISGNTGVGISYSSTLGGTVTGLLTGDLIQSNLLGGVLISNATGVSLSGLTIGGPGALGNGGYGVSVTGSSNVTLGGTVAGAGLTVKGNFGPGIAISATSTGVQVLNSTISGNTGDGLDITNSAGIVVTGDTIASNLGYGVLVTATPGIAITGDTIGGTVSGLGNGLAGISLVGSTGAIIGGTLAGAGDLVGFNLGDGIDFDAASTGGQVVGSAILSNGGVGVSFTGPGGVTPSGDLVNQDTIQSNRMGGVLITAATGTIVEASTIGGLGSLGNGFYGISVASSDNSTVESSTIQGNLGDGIQVTSSTGVTLTGLMIESNLGNGVLVSLANNTKILSSTIGGMLATLGNANAGIFATGSTGLTVTGDSINGNRGNGITLVSGSNSALITSSSIGGMTNGTVPGLANGGYGIQVSSSFFETIGGTGIGDFIQFNTAGGIFFESSANSQVLNSQIDGNGGVGIVVMDTSGAILTSNEVSSNLAGGILLSNSPMATVNSSAAGGLSSIEFNGAYGVSVLGSFMTTLGGPTLASGLYVALNKGVGIAIEPSSFGATLGSNGTSVSNSQVLANVGDGIDVAGTTGVILFGSTISGNAGLGISLSGTQATLDAVTVSSNGSSGISAVHSDVQFLAPTITGNAGVGVTIINPSTAPNVTGVIQLNKGGGVLLMGSTVGGTIGAMVGSDFLPGSPALGNGGFGVSISGSTNVEVSGTIIGNQGVGLAINESNGTRLIGPKIDLNQGDGVDAFGSTGLVISTSDISSNLGGGISLSSGSAAAIDHSLVFSNGNFGISSVKSAVQLTISTVTGNTGVGVSIISSTAPALLSADKIQQNQGGGVLILGPMGGTIVGSTIGGETGVIGMGVSTPAGNGGFGVSVNGASGLTIGGTGADAVVVSSNLGTGISISNSSGVSVTGVTVFSNLGTGISLTGDTNPVISNALVYDNISGGIALTNLVGGGSITSTTIGGTTLADGNGLFGLSLVNSDGVTIGASGSGQVLVEYSGGVGISVASSRGVTIQGTSVLANADTGIKLASQSNGAIITGSTISGNTGSGVVASDLTGLALGGIAAGSGLTISGNRGSGIAVLNSSGVSVFGDTIESNRTGGITFDSVFGSSQVAFSTIGGTTANLGNGLVGLSASNSPGVNYGGLLVQYNAGDGIALASSPGSTILGSFIDNNVGAGVKVALGSNGVLLGSDQVGYNAGPGVFVSGSTMVTLGGAASAGLTIIGNQLDGIDLNAAPLATILGTEVTGNYAAGINVINSAGTAIGSPTVAVSVHGNGGDGIDLSASAGSQVANTTVLNNFKTGLSITSPGVTISTSKFLGNAGSGIEVNGPGNSFTATDGLNASGNKGFGVLILNSANNQIVGPNVTSLTIDANGSVGVEILGAGSTNNLVRLATVDHNGVSGISVDDGASANKIENDVITFNGQAGIQISNGSNNNQILGDQVGADLGGNNGGNGGNGVSVIGSSGTVIGQDTRVAFNASNGVSLVSSKFTAIQPGTVIAQNGSNGISLVDSANNVVGSIPVGPVVTIVSNKQSGVQIVGTDSIANQILGSVILDNGVNGVGIANGGANLVAADIINGNMVNGVSISNGNQNQISAVSIQHNMGNGVSIADGSRNFVGAGSTIAYNLQSGVQISGADSDLNQVAGNVIMENTFNGVTVIQATSTGIGGPSASYANVIVLNHHDGISIQSTEPGKTPTTIVTTINYNFIGVGPDGVTGMGNVGEGINVNNSNGVQIGVAGSDIGNVISDNHGGGIELSNSNFNVLENNRIGTDAIASQIVHDAIGFSQIFGVYVNESEGNRIGGTAVGSRNYIAGTNYSGDFGIQLFGPDTTGNTILGNTIGVTAVNPAAPGGHYSLGDHVGIFISSAKSNTIAANIIGGSDLAEILVAGNDATGNVIGNLTNGGNDINGSFLIAPGLTPIKDATPVGIQIDATVNTKVMFNTFEGLTVGVDLFGYPFDLTQDYKVVNPTYPTTTLPTPGSPSMTVVANNIFTNNSYGVSIVGSPYNLVTGNSFLGSPNPVVNGKFTRPESVAGVEILGPQSVNNTIGGVAASAKNFFSDNLYGVYVQDSPENYILGNQVNNTSGIYTNPSNNSYQAGVYLYDQQSTNNLVLGNMITNVQGYGIVFLNTPQTTTLANSGANNQVKNSLITDYRPDAVLTPVPPNFTLPSPGSLTADFVPQVSAASVGKTASVKVQVSSAFTGKRPISPKASHHGKVSKTTH